MEKYSYIHSDFFNYFSHLLASRNKRISVSKALDVMMKDIKSIAKKKIIMPTFNYSFTNKKIFDYYRDESQVGSFSEFFRSKYQNYRTETPVFSHVGNFDLRKIIKSTNPFENSSVFSLLKKTDSEIIMFGADFAPTYIIYIENSFKGGIIYRYNKTFKGKIKKKKKINDIKTKFPCRPQSLNIKYDLNKIKRDLKRENILKKMKSENNFQYYMLSTKDFHDFSVSKLKKNQMYFLTKKSSEIVRSYLKNKKRFFIKDFENV